MLLSVSCFCCCCFLSKLEIEDAIVKIIKGINLAEIISYTIRGGEKYRNASGVSLTK